MEEWRPIPSQPGYEASNLGRVRSLPKPAITSTGRTRIYGNVVMRHQVSTGNRPIVTIAGKRLKVGRLVCEAFHGAPTPGAVCMHINDDPSDNRAENLRWGTQRENLNAPKFLAYCRSRLGENSPWAKHVAKKQAQQTA